MSNCVFYVCTYLSDADHIHVNGSSSNLRAVNVTIFDWCHSMNDWLNSETKANARVDEKILRNYAIQRSRERERDSEWVWACTYTSIHIHTHTCWRFKRLLKIYINITHSSFQQMNWWTNEKYWNVYNLESVRLLFHLYRAQAYTQWMSMTGMSWRKDDDDDDRE